MKRLSTILLLLVSAFVVVSAQQKVSIKGIVLSNADNEPIEQASIRVLNAKDSTYIAGTATNQEGAFSIAVSPGKYILNTSYLGYRSEHLDVNATKNPTSISTIRLHDDGVLLGEAVVTAKAAEIAVRGDTVEYNADSYKVQESAVLEDLLKKMPGAEVDSEGKITINGKEIKKILVDGKEFFSTDPKVASKNLPAQMIEKLQVLDRKSDMAQMTGFDDGDEETVINLTVKKGMKEGLFGNTIAGAGNHGKYGLSGIANYMRNENQVTVIAGSNNTNNEGFTDDPGGSFRGIRPRGGLSFGGQNGVLNSTNGGVNFAISSSPKLQWGGNARFGDSKNDVELKSYTQRYTVGKEGKDQFENKTSFGQNKSTNFNTDLRFEWTPDSLTKIIFSPNIQYGKNHNNQESGFLTTYENPADSINWGQSRVYSEGDSRSVSGRLEISRQLGKKGRVLSLSLSGGFNDLDNNGTNWSKTTFRENQRDSVDLKDQIFNQKNKGHNWRGYISYVEPIGNNNFIQLNYSYRKNYSESDKETFLNNGADDYSIVDTTATKKLENNFINQEIGINFKAVREKYDYTIGAALQPSSSESWTITPKVRSKVSNSVLNFAPVAQFNYRWDRRRSMRVNYNGTTSQPSTIQLSDVRDESNPMNITYGNPDLKPSFSNRFRIRYHMFNPEQRSAFIIGADLTFTTNDIVDKTLRRSNGVSETTYANTSGNWESSARMIINKPLKNKKFSINSFTMIRYRANNGFLLEEDSTKAIIEYKNTSKSITLMERIGLQYRSDMFDFGVGGNINYQGTRNSLEQSTNSNRDIYNYGGNFTSTVYLPFDITFMTDLIYSGNSGTTAGYNKNEWIWNASIAKQIFKAKNGTIKFNIYDILQNQTNISQSSSASAFTETITNTLGSYFMFSFVYRFQIFKGGAKMGDMDSFQDRERFGGGRPPRR